MNELLLKVDLPGWNLFVKRKLDKRFQPVAQKIFKRDNYCCQFCGFQAQQYQEIVNQDGNYRNNKASNMMTACLFCVQCLFLQTAGQEEIGGGQLIYLPEISQANLNSICHVLFCAMDNNTGYQDSANAIYRSFRFRSQLVENHFGSGMSDPATMGQLLLEYQGIYTGSEVNMLANIRLLPSYTKFKVPLDAWTEAAMSELSDDHESVADNKS